LDEGVSTPSRIGRVVVCMARSMAEKESLCRTI
jgi:hypothetical protein